MTEVGGKATNRLLEYMAAVYKTRDLANVDAMGMAGPKAPLRSRQKTVNLSATFEGSAAAFDELTKAGIPIRMTVGQLVDGNLKRLSPNREKARDRDQGLNPFNDFDLNGALVNTIALAEPLNTMSQAVGLVTNGLPKAYAETKKQQIEELSKELGIVPRNADIVAHIPPGTRPDARQIPILKEIVNGFHGNHVTKTFGGITEKHLWTGVIPLEPKLAASLGLPAPPPEHEPAEPPPGYARAYNSWAIVPVGHVLGHIKNLPPSDIKKFGYVVYQLSLPDRTAIPFLLMDLWTLHRYSEATCRFTLRTVDEDRVAIPDIYIELSPLSKDTWLNSCMAGQHFDVGRVSFRLLLTYTVFPKDFRTDARIVCALSEGFPRMSLDMRMKLDTSEGDQPSRIVAPKKTEDETVAVVVDAKRVDRGEELRPEVMPDDYVSNQLQWGAQ